MTQKNPLYGHEFSQRRGFRAIASFLLCLFGGASLTLAPWGCASHVCSELPGPAASAQPDSVAVANEALQFHYRGKWIHPELVQHFGGFLGVSYVASVDVSNAFETEGFVTPQINAGWISYKDPASRSERSFFKYRYLGMTSDGTHVLWTAQNAGGTATPQSLLFVRLVEGPPYILYDWPQKTPRLLMVLVGWKDLGPGVNGAVLQGNDIVFRQLNGLPDLHIHWPGE